MYGGGAGGLTPNSLFSASFVRISPLPPKPHIPPCRDEDDLYTLYATLFCEPSTFLVTNDFQGVNRGRLPHEYCDIFEQWLRRRLATLIKVGKHVNIKVRNNLNLL